MKWQLPLRSTRRERGQRAESAARQWLEKQGMVHVESNWRCRLGEIDLVMRDQECWVFVEVRLRTTRDFGGALASVTPHKQRRLIAAAGLWLSYQTGSNAVCRFDVVGMEPDANGLIQYQWIKNAFSGEFS